MPATCDATLLYGDQTLHCALNGGHVKPTGTQPQGSPHEDPTLTDELSGEPFRWWGPPTS